MVDVSPDTRFFLKFELIKKYVSLHITNFAFKIFYNIINFLPLQFCIFYSEAFRNMILLIISGPYSQDCQGFWYMCIYSAFHLIGGLCFCFFFCLLGQFISFFFFEDFKFYFIFKLYIIRHRYTCVPHPEPSSQQEGFE